MASGERSLAVTGLSALDATLQSVGMQRMKRPYQPQRDPQLARVLGADRRFIFEGGPSVDAMDAARQIAQNPDVESATVDWRAFPAVAPNDPIYPDQWGHNNRFRFPRRGSLGQEPGLWQRRGHRHPR